MNKCPLNLKIGIIGGGQLGKMMILSAKKFGIFFVTLDPNENCPSKSISDELIVADFNDKEAIKKLAKKVDIITYEFEHIDCEILMELENDGYRVYPTSKSLKIIQNKISQKEILKQENISVADFICVDENNIKKVGDQLGYPFILKTATGGYDGKGNYIIKDKNDVENGFKELGFGRYPLLAEKLVDFECEISILACRNEKGQIEIYPVVQNQHIDSILHKTIAPANLSEMVISKAENLARKVIQKFNGVGIFCIEMFVCKDDEVLVNEIAPRPHNSGHYTIEACITSQFENHIRAILNLPLGSGNILHNAVMINLLGDSNANGETIVTGIEDALKIEGISVHIYGKEKVSPKRKMGHLTAIGKTLSVTEMNADKAYSEIAINSL